MCEILDAMKHKKWVDIDIDTDVDTNERRTAQRTIFGLDVPV